MYQICDCTFLIVAAFLMCLKYTPPVNSKSLNLKLCLTCWGCLHRLKILAFEDSLPGLADFFRFVCSPAANQTFGSSTPGCCSGHHFAQSSERELAIVGIVSFKDHSRIYPSVNKMLQGAPQTLQYFDFPLSP